MVQGVKEWNLNGIRKKLLRTSKSITFFFQEAATVFGDPLAITFVDPDHSVNEQRYIIFGLSRYNQLLVVSHTDRGGRIRIISARLMTRKEKKIYEEG